MTPETKTNKPTAFQDFLARMGVLGEFIGFLARRKQYWLIPLMMVFLVFALIVVLGNTPGVGQFIYTLF
jgi:hypothetical protein